MDVLCLESNGAVIMAYRNSDRRNTPPNVPYYTITIDEEIPENQKVMWDVLNTQGLLGKNGEYSWYGDNGTKILSKNLDWVEEV